MVELKGSLSGIGLPALVQLIGELHHTGALHLERSNASGILAFDDGRLVAAECGDTHGLDAVASCALTLMDAEFTFVEGESIAERTLDLGPADLKKLLTRVMDGTFNGTPDSGVEPEQTQVALENTCPLLGFADDRGRHYSRPTALHRCFAGGSASTVTPQEQRELCLSGRYSTCPRFRNAGHFAPAQTAPTPQIPAGVAARLAAASEMTILPTSQQGDTELPSWIGNEEGPSAPTQTPPSKFRTRPSLRLIGVGTAVGLVFLALLALVLLPGLTAPKSTPAVSPLEPVATATRVQVAAARATSAPTLDIRPTPPPVVVPTTPPTVVPATPTTPPTSAARPTTVIAAANTLVNLRFASGPAPRWLENPPYASWSDGAYRLHAKDSGNFVAAGIPLDRAFSDVLVSATFRKTGGPPGGGYGLIVRDQGPEPRDGVNQQGSFYVFEAGDRGEYGIWRRDGDHWVDLVPWTQSNSVRPGGSPNSLTVEALGTKLMLNINGIGVASVEDDAIASGGLGLFVGGDNNEVALDYFSVSLPN